MIQGRFDKTAMGTPWVDLPGSGYRVELPYAYPVTTNLIHEIKTQLKRSSTAPDYFFWDDLVNIKNKSGKPVVHRLHWPQDSWLHQQCEFGGKLAVRSELMNQLFKAGKISRQGSTTEAMEFLAEQQNGRFLSEVFRFVGNERDKVYRPKQILKPRMSARSISVIINYKDRAELTCKAIESVLESQVHAEVEIVLINNNSTKEEYKKIERYCHDNERTGFKFQLLDFPLPYNHSAQCNLGIEKSTSEVIFFFNNDAELTDPKTLQTLSDWCLTPGVASAGPKILGKEGQLVSSGIGITLNNKPGVTNGAFIQEIDTVPLSESIHSTCGNTFATAAVSRETLSRLGPLDEEQFSTQFNDAEYALRAIRAGYSHIYIGHVSAFHQPGTSGGESKQKSSIQKKRSLLAAQYPEMKEYVSVAPQAKRLDTKLHYGRVQRTFLKSLGIARKLSWLHPGKSQALTEALVQSRQRLAESFPNIFGRITLSEQL